MKKIKKKSYFNRKWQPRKSLSYFIEQRRLGTDNSQDNRNASSTSGDEMSSQFENKSRSNAQFLAYFMESAESSCRRWQDSVKNDLAKIDFNESHMDGTRELIEAVLVGIDEKNRIRNGVEETMAIKIASHVIDLVAILDGPKNVKFYVSSDGSDQIRAITLLSFFLRGFFFHKIEPFSVMYHHSHKRQWSIEPHFTGSVVDNKMATRSLRVLLAVAKDNAKFEMEHDVYCYSDSCERNRDPEVLNLIKAWRDVHVSQTPAIKEEP